MKLKPKIRHFLSLLSMFQFILIVSIDDFNYAGFWLFLALIMAFSFNVWVLDHYG